MNCLSRLIITLAALVILAQGASSLYHTPEIQRIVDPHAARIAHKQAVLEEYRRDLVRHGMLSP